MFKLRGEIAVMDIPLENISGKVGINGALLKKLSSAEKKELKIILKNLQEATHNIPDEKRNLLILN